MSKIYREVPDNFNDIEEYVITDPTTIVESFFKYENHFFYDTCSILHHSNAICNDRIIEFLIAQSGIIIITRTVLMELSSSTFLIDSVQIDYLRKLHENGIPILLMDEEIVLMILKDTLSISNEVANQLLGYAVKEVCKFKTAIYNVMSAIDDGIRNRILHSNPGIDALYEPFFKAVRLQKTEKDSLAEELILICIIVLTKVPLGKYILVSDDLKIRNSVISITEYIQKQHGLKAPMQLTTSRLVYELYKKGILTVREDMINILTASFHGNMKVFYIGADDIQLMYDSLTKEDLIDKMLTISEFRIVY